MLESACTQSPPAIVTGASQLPPLLQRERGSVWLPFSIFRVDVDVESVPVLGEAPRIPDIQGVTTWFDWGLALSHFPQGRGKGSRPRTRNASALSQGLADFFWKGPTVDILGFAGHGVSIRVSILAPKWPWSVPRGMAVTAFDKTLTDTEIRISSIFHVSHSITLDFFFSSQSFNNIWFAGRAKTGSVQLERPGQSWPHLLWRALPVCPFAVLWIGYIRSGGGCVGSKFLNPNPSSTPRTHPRSEPVLWGVRREPGVGGGTAGTGPVCSLSRSTWVHEYTSNFGLVSRESEKCLDFWRVNTFYVVYSVSLA